MLDRWGSPEQKKLTDETGHAGFVGQILLLSLLLGAFVALGLTYVWAIPPYEGPDEYAHLKYIAYLLDTKGLPQLDAATSNISHQLVQQPPLYYVLAATVVTWTPVDLALAYAEPNPYINKNESHRAYLTLPETPPEALFAPRAARFVSLLGATLAVLGTWLMVRRLLPQWAWAAYVGAALVGFNPQFLFGAATVTNDMWAAALPVWALWLALGAEKSPRPWRAWFGVGMLLGAAALTKYSALAVAAPLGIVGLVHVHRQGWRDWPYLVRNAGSAVLGFVLVAGWWFARNMILVGEAIPFNTMVAVQPVMAWGATRAWDDVQLWQGVRWLLRSYWGVFGYGIIAPAAYHGIVQKMLLLALAGYLLWLVRARFARVTWLWLPLLLACSWFAISFVGLLNWMRVMRFTDQGRLLFPAAPAIATLILLGWAAWLPSQMQRWGALLAVALMIGLGVSQVETLHAHYALPPALHEPVEVDRPIEARFDAGMTLLGIDLPDGAALDAGDVLPITLYWTTDKVVPDNYTLFIHLADANNQLLYHFDGVPYDGRHPTRQWLPGQRFADTYTLTVARSRMEEGLDKLAALSVGFYPIEAPTKRQQATALATGELLGDRLQVAQVRVHADAKQAALAATPVARWQQGIQLAGQEIRYDAQGVPQWVFLRWQATQTLHTDYTVFVQLLDVDNRVLSQVDRQPQGGEWPTSTWRTGDVIEEKIDLPPPTGAWSQVIVGLYDRNGTVLEVVEPEAGNYFVLARAD